MGSGLEEAGRESRKGCDAQGGREEGSSAESSPSLPAMPLCTGSWPVRTDLRRLRDLHLLVSAHLYDPHVDMGMTTIRKDWHSFSEESLSLTGLEEVSGQGGKVHIGRLWMTTEALSPTAQMQLNAANTHEFGSASFPS